MATLDDPTNSACDLRIPHKQAIAALLLGTVTEATGAKWMEENFLEIERWVRYVRLNGCMSSASPDCSPVPGGSLQCDWTIGQVATGDPLVSVNTTRTSSWFDAYFTHSDFTWTAAAACTVFVSFSARVESGGTANTLGLKYGTGPTSGVSATAGDGVTLAASDLIEVAAGDDLWLELAHDGGGNASVYGARFTLLIVCTAASEPPPPG